MREEERSIGQRFRDMERSLKEHRDWHAHLEKNLSDYAHQINHQEERIRTLESLVEEIMLALERARIPRYPK